jgi:hypothetical protein
MSDTSQGPGRWQAPDGKWYPPETHPAYGAPVPVSQSEARGDRDADDTEAERVEDDDEEQPSPAKAKLHRVTVATRVTYVGGLGGRKCQGSLVVNDECLGVGTFRPRKAIVRWADIEWLDLDDGQVRKSGVGAAAAVGVFALAKRGSEQSAGLTVHRKDGRDVFYRIARDDAFALKAKLTPHLRKVSVPWRDEQTREAASSNAGPADELRKLAEIRDQGILTDEEFAAQKAKLLQ